MIQFETFTLPNGIRCVLGRENSSSVVHCGLTIGVGSRDEAENEYGIAHFIEHCIFKGTKKRRAYQINNRLDNLGGELNAFTTKEETVVHATTLKKHFPKAIELIADVVFNSTFPAKELDKERDVILDEINSYKDSPAELIYDDFEELLFQNNPLGHQILGSKKSLKHFDSDAVCRFINRTYTTDKMVFSAIGNITISRFKELCYKYLANIISTKSLDNKILPDDYKHFNITKNKKTHQVHCIIGNRGYRADDPKRIVLSLLVNILGGPQANSILNTSLREKNGLSYNIEASYTPFKDSGEVTVYFSTDKELQTKCLTLINSEIEKIRTEGLSKRALSIAKKQYIGQLAIAMENKEGCMLSAGKSMLLFNNIDPMDKMADRINSITNEEIIEVANEIFGENISILTYK